MKTNSRAEFIGMMRDEGSKYNPPMLQLGEVKSINPIQIVTGDLPLLSDNLYMNKQLLGYTESVTITTDTTSYTANIVHTSILAIGDKVILYPVENGQKYIMLGVV